MRESEREGKSSSEARDRAMSAIMLEKVKRKCGSLGLSLEGRVGLRAFLYVMIIVLLVSYTVGAFGDLWVFSKCLLQGPDECARDQLEERRIGYRFAQSKDLPIEFKNSFSVGNLSTLIAMTVSYWLSGVLSLLIVWLIDHSGAYKIYSVILKRYPWIYAFTLGGWGVSAR